MTERKYPKMYCLGVVLMGIVMLPFTEVTVWKIAMEKALNK